MRGGRKGWTGCGRGIGPRVVASWAALEVKVGFDVDGVTSMLVQATPWTRWVAGSRSNQV